MKNKTLHTRFPLLFKQTEVAVGDGWHGLLETLCTLLYGPYVRAKDNYDRTCKTVGTAPYPGAKVVTDRHVHEARQALQEAEANLPRVVQVKEKLGTLRFYANQVDERAAAYINFAEHMSGKICEVCGAPGTRGGKVWVKTLCETHRESN